MSKYPMRLLFIACNALLFLCTTVHAQFLGIEIENALTDPVTGDELHAGALMMFIVQGTSSDGSALDFAAPFFLGGNDSVMAMANDAYNPLCYYDSASISTYGISFPVTYAGMVLDKRSHALTDGDTVTAYVRIFNNLAGYSPPEFGLSKPSFDDTGRLRTYLYGDYNDIYFTDSQTISFTIPDALSPPDTYTLSINNSDLLWNKGFDENNSTAPDLIPWPEKPVPTPKPAPQPKPEPEPAPEQPAPTDPPAEPQQPETPPADEPPAQQEPPPTEQPVPDPPDQTDPTTGDNQQDEPSDEQPPLPIYPYNPLVHHPFATTSHIPLTTHDIQTTPGIPEPNAVALFVFGLGILWKASRRIR